jgi:hypothetical protein
MYHSGMRRTSILLPQSLRNRADRHAHSLGISFGELVRRALAAMLSDSERPAGSDSFFADGAIYSGDLPSGASIHHDEHLYPGPER